MSSQPVVVLVEGSPSLVVVAWVEEVVPSGPAVVGGVGTVVVVVEGLGAEVLVVVDWVVSIVVVLSLESPHATSGATSIATNSANKRRDPARDITVAV